MLFRSRTGTRLVSPTRGHEKKKGTPSSLGSNLGFRIVECARVCQNVAYSIRICKNEPLIKENIRRKNLSLVTDYSDRHKTCVHDLPARMNNSGEVWHVSLDR